MWRRLLVWAVALMVVALVAFILVQVACDQSYPYDWAARYDGETGGSDEAVALVVDPDGNICVTGFTERTSNDFLTLKYNSEGALLWEAVYDGPAAGYDKARAIAVDGQGNLYVAGQSEGNGTLHDFAVVKYAPDGRELWVARYDGPVHAGDAASDLCLGPDGSLYVTGYSAGNGADYVTIKYSSAGDELWVARYDGPRRSGDIPNAICVDEVGNTYVTGESSGNGTGFDCATVKYDSDGSLAWVARYDGPVSDDDEGLGLALDADGGLYIVGYTTLERKNGRTETDCITIRYDGDGNKEWIRRYNVPEGGAARLNAVTTDESGHVYVAGSSTFTVRDYTSSDAIAVKYTLAGDEAWFVRYDSPVRMNDGANALAVDSGGAVYIAGSSVEIGSHNDYILVKYDSDGNEQWYSRYNGPAGRADTALDIAIDESDNVYVTGYSYGEETSSDAATLKYTP